MVVENESALKHLFGKPLLKRIADSLTKHDSSFDRKRFQALFSALEPLEMKPRVRLIRDRLRDLLPPDYPTALAILVRSAQDGTLEGFDLWPYTEFVQTFGLEDRVASLNALLALTPVFTAEWAVRPFLIRYPQETLLFLQKCARSEDEHLRRWASEGSRPRLPWGERLQDFVRDPKPTLPILEALKSDPALYVRKSVANHLNDISKDHPKYVIEVLRRWQKEGTVAIDWIIRRSLRTLIKEGHPGALKLIGVSPAARIEIRDFKIGQTQIKLGERFEFKFSLHSLSARPQKLVVDYIVHFRKANDRTAAKVFKLKNTTIPAKGAVHFSKSHHFKKITTREYYSGAHVLEIQVNGLVVGKREWKLKV